MASSATLVFAGRSVAVPAISFLVNKAFRYLSVYFGATSMEETRNKLDRGMPKIQAVLDISHDHMKDKSEALDTWFWQLRDAVEEAEDAIDELEYYELEEKINDLKISDWGSSFAKMKHKVTRSVKNISFLDKTVKQFTHHDTITKLRKAIENLDKVVQDITHIITITDYFSGAGSSSQAQGQLVSNDRQTGFMLSATKFVGREKEKQQIISWLTNTPSVQSAETLTCTEGIPIFSVIGHGGMGKTILAQIICQEDEVLKHFQIIWVTVSTSFDATSLTSKIIESATKKKSSTNHLASLQEELKEILKSIQFLLVLDDVWEDKKIDEWEKLFASLRKLNTMSKILLTTRMQSVVDMAVKVMEVERDQYLILKELDHAENIERLRRHVFSGLNLHDHEHLASIGDQIATKLGGCPLVTKVVSGHLQSNMKPEYWSKFLHTDLEHFKGSANDIMKVLRLSYYHLSTDLQICFRYCSIFAQDYEFDMKELVQMWMGSGLISHATSDSITFEDIGEQILAQLTRKSFFDIRSKVTLDGSKREWFVMHDLMHELSRNVSFGECTRITEPDMFGNMRDTLRHMYVSCICGFSGQEVKKIPNLKNLRTIIIDATEYDLDQEVVCTLEKIIKNSKSLRLIHLGARSTSYVFVKFGELKHLRYIKLGHISPEDICEVAKLYHLTLFQIEYSGEETKHTRYLGYLDSLRYVTYGASGLGEFSIKNLTSLQELEDYKVQGSTGNKLSAIRSLQDLRKLELSGLENVENHEEAIKANLNAKTNLVSLSLNWSRCSDAQNMTSDLVLEHLEPHVNIMKLSISGFNGLRIPFWIENLSLKNLVSLSFIECQNWEDIPSLVELVALRQIELLDLRKLKQIVHPRDVSSRSSMELVLPPNLGILIVRNCLELHELPILPSSLVNLQIEYVGLTILPMMAKISTESSTITASQLLGIIVHGCPDLTSLEGSLFEQKLYMRDLRTLHINNCIQLESASVPFEEMDRLNKLCIVNCPKLRTVRDARNILLSSSLTDVTIGQCGDMEIALFEAVQRLTNLSSLMLHNCLHLVSLPSAEVFSTSFKSLSHLYLWECENISSLGGLGSLPSLEYLCITKCMKLMVSVREEEYLVTADTSLQLESLSISSPSLLLIEPLNSFCQTQNLTIQDGREMKSLPEGWLLQNHSSLSRLDILEAESLESLPPSMSCLSSLKILVVYCAGRLQSLSDLPSSLERLEIHGCHPDLEKKVRDHASPERNMISHIPQVKLVHKPMTSDAYFIMNKECNNETFYKIRWESHTKLISWAEQQKDEKSLTWWKKVDCLTNSS